VPPRGGPDSVIEDWRDRGFDAVFEDDGAGGGAAWEEEGGGAKADGGFVAGAKDAGGRKAPLPLPTPLVQLSTELWREKDG